MSSGNGGWLVWRGRQVGTLRQVAEICNVQPATYTSYRQRLTPPPPGPITYRSSDWGDEEIDVVLTHPTTGEQLYDRGEVEEFQANRRGVGWRAGRRHGTP